MKILSLSNDATRKEPHLFIESNRTYSPKPRPPGGFPPEYYHVDEEAPMLDEQINETIQNLEEKVMGDKNTYYILDFFVSNKHPIIDRIIKRLNANILSEINETQLLVTSTIDSLKNSKDDILKYGTYRSSIFSIYNLRPIDIIDEKLITDNNFTEKKILTFHLVPNIGLEKATIYISQINGYTQDINAPILASWIDPNSGSALIDISMNIEEMYDFIKRTDFLYKVHERITIHSNRPSSEPTLHDFRSEDLSEEEVDALPIIGIFDTGVNQIPHLVKYIKNRIMMPPLSTLDDINNHGTSVASLAVYGDTIGNFQLVHTPKAQITSIKILEGNQYSNIYASLADAIETNPEIKIFNCSLGFDSSRLAFTLLTERVNSLVQSNNKIVVFSSGNVEPSDLRQIFNQGGNYPQYLANAPVFHPSDAPSVFSVGAMTKLSNQTSLAPANAPSPITRFGTNLKDIQNCPKPELVEHGGNVCYANNTYTCTNVGIQAFDNVGSIREEAGTSYSAPLVSQHAARLWSYFKDRINNSETVKALLLSTCNPTTHHPRYVGFGFPNEGELFSSTIGTVRIIFEGILNLITIAEGSEVIPVDELRVFVPSDVEYIELYLVHSDDYQLRAFPSLNTYLRVITEKPGKKGSVNPYSGIPYSKTNIKKLVYRYIRNIKGNWFFKIIPHHIRIPSRDRINVTIRYGGVIKLISKRPSLGLAERVIEGMQRGESTQISLTDFLHE